MQRKWVIQLSYGIPFLLFIFLLIESFNEWSSKTNFGLTHLELYGMASAIFLIQLVRNSILGWALVIGLYLFQLTFLLIDLKELFALYGAKYDSSQVITYLLVLLVYLIIGYFYFLLKPKSKRI